MRTHLFTSGYFRFGLNYFAIKEMMAAVAAVHGTMTARREGVPPSRLANVASPQLMQRPGRDADCARWTGNLLT